MSRAIIVPDLAYTSPSGRRGGSSNGYKELSRKVRYYQYRDNADGHIPQEKGVERWVDHGLGLNYREILRNCSELSSDKVLAWTWVISPAPDLMALVPEPEREALVVSLTEQIVEAYYEARDMDLPEYSLVLHDRLTNASDIRKEPLHQLHTHVILPGTVPSIEGHRLAFFNRSNKGHIKLLRDISTEKFSIALDDTVGPQWRELRPEVEPEPLQPAYEPIPKMPALPMPQAQNESENDLADWFEPRKPDHAPEHGLEIS